MRTLLIVDDDPGVSSGLSRVLRKEAYKILSANSAVEGLDVLSLMPVDAVISDQEMPGMSGTVFLKAVRDRYPDTVRFILTGRATLPVALQAINAGGVSRFFLKPCNHVDLLVALRQELEKRDLMVAARRLLGKVKRQSALLENLEVAYPSITEVRCDEDGAILLEDVAGDVPTLIAQIYDELEHSGPQERPSE